jgi:L-iditol 2-dehydrogenase
MITDVSDFRLGKALECGIDLCVNPSRIDLSAAVKEHFGEGKADLILECVGTPAAITQAVAVARKGTDIIVVGVFGDKPVVDMGTVQDRELRLVGTLMYQKPDWMKAIELVKSVRVKLAPLITNHFPFVNYTKAYEYIDANSERAMKVMIVLEQ